MMTLSKFYLRRIRLNSGGYDSFGSYWGVDLPLYRYDSDSLLRCDHIRARSRDEAKEKIRLLHPTAIFFR